MTTLTGADLDALKARQKATWMAGDFGEVAKLTETTAIEFMARRGLKPRMRVLDVACGTGNLAIPAAKGGAQVTGIDIAPNLLDQARTRASRDGLAIGFEIGDAENLPFEEGSFDLVVSMFGAMFAPRPELVATELVRVCRPGGQIAMANWTPAGFIGQLFAVTGRHVPPPLNVPSALLWGEPATVRDRFHDHTTTLRMTCRVAHLKLPFAVARTVEFYRSYYGPTQKAFAILSEEKQTALRRDMESLYTQHNRACDDTTHVEAEYLDIEMTCT